MRKTITYSSFEEDVVTSARQEQKVPKNYKWFHTSRIYRAVSALVYGLFVVFAQIYTRGILRVKVENKQPLKRAGKGGYVLYGNHTQPVGDVFAPAIYALPRRIVAVAAPANLGIPVLGKILPMLGAIVTPESLPQMKEFMKAVEVHLKAGRALVIYPEAHVWPYYTEVRPFPATSFRFPVAFQVPAYVLTTTYQTPKRGKKPKIVVYIDGPFLADDTLDPKAAQRKLWKEVTACMKERSKNSNYEYISYIQREAAEGEKAGN